MYKETQRIQNNYDNLKITKGFILPHSKIYYKIIIIKIAIWEQKNSVEIQSLIFNKDYCNSVNKGKFSLSCARATGYSY